MNFKQIELVGFKSFADKLDIKFNDGITAIVGPNGCGKSNVADAIRWVLGEQSAKLLRAGNMQDVIFNGTEKRKSMSYCEVSLSFDNSKRFFNIDFDDIVITRKLYRSGESEYLLNRAPCRLKDITNILHDSGMGRDGYSIIGQGKVEEIITAKPENRRAIFEDAAGISKFKARKVEAERKLERTQDNLTRVQDILSEVDRQLGPLKHQAENAKKYLEYRDQLKVYEVNNYIYQYDNANSQKDKIQTRINAIVEELEVKQTGFTQQNDKYNASMLEVSKIDQNLEDMHNKILELTVGIEKQTGESRLALEKIKYMQDRKESLSQDLSRQTLNKKNAELQLKATREQLEKVNTDFGRMCTEANELSDEYLRIVDELTQREDEQSTKQQQMVEALAQLGDIKSNLSALKAQKEAYENNLNEIEAKLNISDNKLKQKKREQDELTTAIKQRQEANRELENRIYNLNTELTQANNDYNAVNSDIFTLNSNIQLIDNRRQALVDMQKDFDGYNYAVKRLMQDSERNSALKKQIVGVVASLMTIPSGFETAIETALGGAVQNIVTNNEDDSKELIKYLKNNNAGRATFLPVTSMRGRGLTPQELGYTKRKNCYGVASSIIKYDKNLSSVFESLLGRTIVVDTINDAVALAKDSNFAFKIVTLDGDVVNPQGSMSGGSKKAMTSNLLMRENEIASLNDSLKKLNDKLSVKNDERQKLSRTCEGLRLQLDQATKEQVDLQIECAKLNESLEQASAYLRELAAENSTLNQEKSLINTKIEATVLTINQVEVPNENVTMSRANVTEEMTRRQSENAAMKARRDETHDTLTNLKIQIASKEQEINSLKNEIDRLENYLTETTDSITEIEASLASITRTVSQAEELANAHVDSETLARNQRELEIVKKQLAGLDGKKQELQLSIKLADEQRMILTDEINKLLDKKYQEEFNLSKVDTELEAMQEKIFEDYELTYASCLEYKQENYDVYEGTAQANKLKKDIAKLGHVNVNAIEDSKLLQERFDTMNEQANDLIAARDDLLKIIKELAGEMITRFETEFVKINNNFGKVFKELFGGGNARLELTESEDPLLAGVEIVAEPPGKKLQSINLLSGGEKALTAIAILFAILKLRPMPFCLLDEIEAALDDSNVERFASYLKRFSQDTQFIVVTHRKPTMELADSLYGVTMEEKGVSKLVSVKLDEAVKNATTK